MKAQGTPYHAPTKSQQMKRHQERDALVRMRKLGMNFKIIPDPVVDPVAEKAARVALKAKRRVIKAAKRASRGS